MTDEPDTSDRDEQPAEQTDEERADVDEFRVDDEEDADANDESNAHASAVAEQLAQADEEDLEAAGIDPDEVEELDADEAEGPHPPQPGEEQPRKTTTEEPPEPVDPLADDFDLGDPAIDLATGRTVVIVDRVADRTDKHSERENYEFTENYGNERTRVNDADPVFEAVYVNSLSSKPSKSYDFPSSRLGRPEYENVDGVDRVYDLVARDVLEAVFDSMLRNQKLDADDVEAVAKHIGVVDPDLVDEARELAEVEADFGGDDDD
ncbi:MAG: hypothetical protein SV760_00790 [Halobacteria archaeon]|nr:hypothetical protein [Halobacteria archaeon]